MCGAIAVPMARQTISAVIWIGMVGTVGHRLRILPGLAVYFLCGLGRYAPGKVAHVLGRVVLLGP
ncbi:MAG: hypothetical protein FJ033_10695 [Chloroflexi bacterium]|nr:hypothetical protein [Chloroflexota bacterium]